MTPDQELAHEMSQPVFRHFDPHEPWVIIRKDYEEGSCAMWREYERFPSREMAQVALRTIRENQCAYEDRTGYECMTAYRIVQQDLS